jgi:protein-S-isoprenylcysteine O-methyltransferase Ste14
MNLDILNYLKTPLGIFEAVSVFILGVCIIIILIAILINFIESNKSNVQKEKKSVVETGTMLLFFLFYYLSIRFGLGKIVYTNFYIRIPLMVFSLLVIIIGTYVNVSGRFKLGKNWANQIKIYKDHTLITKGVYKIVRHPLYASLIWMFYAGAIIYFNWIAFLLNTLIFIPFMYYRAKQEENLLTKQFKNYKQYQNNVGMFFPKLKR